MMRELSVSSDGLILSRNQRPQRHKVV